MLTTWCVGDAWYQFCVEKDNIIRGVFRKVGLSLPIDGSKGYELHIKGFSGIDIGNWRKNTNSGDVGTVVGAGGLSTGLGTGLGTGLDNCSSDFQFADVNMEHNECDSIEVVADGE